MKILVLDNYDSFTYNLVHIIRELGYGDQMDIFRNDQISLEAVDAYDKILLSPGPGIPSEAGALAKSDPVPRTMHRWCLCNITWGCGCWFNVRCRPYADGDTVDFCNVACFRDGPQHWVAAVGV